MKKTVMSKQKINKVGITEIDLPFGSFPMICGNQLTFITTKTITKIVLPGTPKWTRSENGKMIPFTIDSQKYQKRKVAQLYELAVNHLIATRDVTSISKKLGIRDEKQTVLELAKYSLLFADLRQDAEMMEKCTWLLKIFRSWPIVIPENKTGWSGAVAYQQLCVIGG